MRVTSSFYPVLEQEHEHAHEEKKTVRDPGASFDPNDKPA